MLNWFDCKLCEIKSTSVIPRSFFATSMLCGLAKQ